mmetsp:Transcript_10353/g.17362  ORF Transcript_10353/g.17362 Transcript_10353/m.17362 type:complete len:474 (-) Transcript_10353:32-1453(-)
MSNDNNKPKGLFGNLIKGVVDNLTKGVAEMKKFDAISQPIQYEPSPKVTKEMMQHFYDNGYVVVPNACSQEVRDVAKRAINRSLGQGPDAVPPHSPFKLVPKIISSCPELMLSPQIVDLLNNSDAIHCVQALVGNTVNRSWGGQIALRYPGDGCIPPKLASQVGGGMIGTFLVQQGLNAATRAHAKQDGGEWVNPNSDDKEYSVIPDWQKNWHIDGWPNPILKNELDEGVENFTCLVGVLLSDVDGPLKGNLTVYPGSHKILQDAMIEAGGPEKLFTTDPQDYSGQDAMSDPQSASLKKLRKMVSKERFPKPVQIQGKAGDVIIAHYQLAHNIAPNVSPDIRYCIYFRVTHSRRKEKTYAPDAMTNIWLEYEGIRRVLNIPEPKRALPAASTTNDVPSSSSLTPEYQEAVDTLQQAFQERDNGSARIALALFEKGIAQALQARSGLSNEAKKETGPYLEKSLHAAEQIKESLK